MKILPQIDLNSVLSGKQILKGIKSEYFGCFFLSRNCYTASFCNSPLLSISMCVPGAISRPNGKDGDEDYFRKQKTNFPFFPRYVWFDFDHKVCLVWFLVLSRVFICKSFVTLSDSVAVGLF